MFQGGVQGVAGLPTAGGPAGVKLKEYRRVQVLWKERRSRTRLLAKLAKSWREERHRWVGRVGRVGRVVRGGCSVQAGGSQD